VCGEAARDLIYDPDADWPTYAAGTPAKINAVTVGYDMPTEAGATYVIDLGYYDYAWWARLDAAGCRIVTRFKSNAPLTLIAETRLRRAAPSSPIASGTCQHARNTVA
jgi:hypothetical protein